jgi:hypothetical protein
MFTNVQAMNPPELIEALSRQRSCRTASLFLSWKQALATLPPLSPDNLQKIATALPSPASARQLARFLSRENEPGQAVDGLLRAVDESEEDLEAWLSGFSVFAGFIDGTAHRPGLHEAIGYLHCCEAMIESGTRYATFAHTVETMLDTYGYEGDSRPPDPEQTD